MSSKQNAIKKIKSLCYLTLGGSIAYQLIYIKKDFNGYYGKVLEPASQYLNPELAHKFGVTAIKYGIFPTESFTDPKILNTKFLDSNLSSPVGIAAGFDKHGDAVLGLKNIGFSIIEVGSVTPEPQTGNPKPRVFRLPEDKAVINRYGFNSEGHNEVYKKMQSINKALLDKCLLGINLGKNKLSENAIHDYTIGIKKFYDVADYFVINISSPNTPGLRSLQKKEELLELLTAVNKTRNLLQSAKRIPLLLKLAPDLTIEEIKDIVYIITKKESNVDGLIISNTTIDKPSLINKTFPNEAGGLSGKPLANKSTEMIKIIYKLTKGKIPIIGVGGVFTGQDAYEKIIAGASVIQIYTALIYHGPPVISKIKSELAEILEREGYKNVSEAVGKGVK
ncbi:dihydroorotate dehydrogenase (quinone), mitochondrial [Achroia grisella]|uniref:dihydroorotate dehydrogenase (quinone), mitochondrial n=1 Tax=Achroia grisella TaxID=688607 RepID=UPI0027D24C71|nr:dihydroorotate dehydrogenase (quinone), mitochondrial [Achroia grisella]XP_059057247.1 dihydroorotate dehydrogenase (quinone), mitochondrial [Achroia grisella]